MPHRISTFLDSNPFWKNPERSLVLSMALLIFVKRNTRTFCCNRQNCLTKETFAKKISPLKACVVVPYWTTFNLLDETLKKFETGKNIDYHILKEHSKLSKIAKFGCEMF